MNVKNYLFTKISSHEYNLLVNIFILVDNKKIDFGDYYVIINNNKINDKYH